MNVELDPRDQQDLEALARANGKEVGEMLRELLHQALAGRKTVAEESGKSASDPAYEASRTELGRRLRALSRKYVENGGKLYSVEEINAEVREGRGERPE